MVISWISAGVSSFIAAYLEKNKLDQWLYIHIDDQHEDSVRFLEDCKEYLRTPYGKLIQHKILMAKRPSVEVACKGFGGFKHAWTGYAPCTAKLKKDIRAKWEKENPGRHTFIWGFDFDELRRAERLLQAMPDHDHIFPLIDRKLTKEDCHGILKELNIKRPKMYEMGYSNNNCIGCVKGGMGYWNKIRVDFPKVFEKRAKLERELGYSMIKGKYLDELDPNAGRMENEIMEDCGILCQLITNKE